jgi:hypothetical protein
MFAKCSNISTVTLKTKEIIWTIDDFDEIHVSKKAPEMRWRKPMLRYPSV